MGDNYLLQNNSTEGYAIYNCADKTFSYSYSLQKMFSAKFDTRSFWQIISEDGIVSELTS